MLGVWARWMLDAGKRSRGVRASGAGYSLKTRHHLSDDALRHLPRPRGQTQLRVGPGVSPQSSSRPSAVVPVCRGASGGHVLELLCDFLQGAVDVKLRAFAERLLANGTEVETVAPPPSIPVGGDAPLAEAVSTGGGDGVLKHLQADGAGELVLTQEGCSQRHDWEAQRGSAGVHPGLKGAFRAHLCISPDHEIP